MKRIIFSLLLVTGLSGLFFLPPEIRKPVLDRSDPIIEIEEMHTIGAGEREISVRDEDSGLDEVLVTIEQGGTVTELVSRRYMPARNSDKITINPANKRGVIKEGDAKLTVRAKDSSLWSNSTTREVSVKIDFAAPKIQLLTLQHIVAQGGVELVLYKATDSNLERHGVRVGDDFYPGFPAKLLDGDLTSQPDLFAAIFAVPLGFDTTVNKPLLFAEDSAENSFSMQLHFRLDKKPQQSADMKLSDQFLQAKVPSLYQSYLDFAADSAKRSEDLVEEFSLVNGDFRRLLDEKLASIFRQNLTAVDGAPRPKLWKEVFIKPMGSATSSTFGEKRTYFYGNREVGRSVHNGFDLASVANDAVRSTNDGIAIFAGDLGIYGHTVLIDHGLGLVSLYGHLSSILVSEGEEIKRGQEIGRTGQTGLAGGDHLHFEFRLAETPVSAIEWWDAKWIKDNIDGKLRDVKEQLGMLAAEEADPKTSKKGDKRAKEAKPFM